MISVDNHVASHAGARQVADGEDRNDTMRPLRGSLFGRLWLQVLVAVVVGVLVGI